MRLAGDKRFRDVYVDPIPVSGKLTDLQVLADRAGMLQHAIDDLRTTFTT
jgi:hypothetical protein